MAADKLSGKITVALRKREDAWTHQQKLLNNDRIIEKRHKGQHHKIYVNKLLDTCKSWHGPCTTADELLVLAVISAHPDKMETIVKTELSYYKHTHAADVTARPELFHLRKIKIACILWVNGCNLCYLYSYRCIQYPICNFSCYFYDYKVVRKGI